MNLTAEQLSAQLTKLPDWTVQNGQLIRTYEFPDFAMAFRFMTAAAFIIERLDHHPTWTNTNNRVEVRLFTHDSNGLTQADINLAELMDQATRV